MPAVNITNHTNTVLNLGFWGAGVPVNTRNGLQPSETWRSEMSSWWYTLDARADRPANRFSPGDGWQSVATIGMAIGSGTASVLTGTAGALGMLSGRPVGLLSAPGSFSTAGKLMDFAHQRTSAIFHGCLC